MIILILHYDNTVTALKQSQITEIKLNDKLKIEVTNQKEKIYWLHESSTLKKQTLNERFTTVWAKNERLRKQHALTSFLTENEALK